MSETVITEDLFY